jgi:hypothetical protein
MLATIGRRIAALLAAALPALYCAPLAAQTYYNGVVNLVYPPDATAPCVRFNLLSDTTRYFALSLALPDFQERYAALLVAATGAKVVFVGTSTTVPACGGLASADILLVVFNP